MKKLVVKIRGDRWNVFYLTRKEYFDRFGDDSVAITQYHHVKKHPQRNMFFSPQDKSVGTIIHELLHAYASYVNIDRPTAAKMEEEMCEMTGRRFSAIMNTALRIKEFFGS